MGKKRLIGLVLAALVGLVFASVAGAQKKKEVQASMLVTGYIDIEPDGRVASWQLDERGKLPAQIAALVDDAAKGWVFEPVLVDGRAAPIKARMRLRLVATEDDSGDFVVSIRHAYFGRDAEYGGDAAATDRVRTVEQKRIHYPRWAIAESVAGTVYVRVRIGRDGRVAEALAEQVNLRRGDTAARMKRGREELAAAALKGVREWGFSIPTTGEEADKPYWDGRITVDFTFDDTGYGQWQVYVPGPVVRAPWADDDIGPDASPDVMVAGEGFQQTRPGLKLLSPLQQG